jgi:hypothetical protein
MVIDDANVPNDENEKKTIVGFKVTPYEHNILKQYAEIFYNQEILDPNTKQQRKLFERLEVGLLIRNTTYSYSYSYSYLFLQSMISL